MSIATEQKVERLLKRMDDLECELSELRAQLSRQHEGYLAELRQTHDMMSELEQRNGARPNKR